MTKSRVLMAQHGKQATIKIEGRGSFENAAAFKTAYLQLLARGAKDFIIDLSSCEALDSTFLGIMVGFGVRLQSEMGKIQIAEANPAITKLLSDVGLDQLFALG